MLEILSPAGNKESALAAINNGANAIYLGLSSFSARQGAENFDYQAFLDIILYAHLCDVKVYVAMNTVIKDRNGEYENFVKNLVFAYNQGADAIILQDPFLGKRIHGVYPQIPLHLSTQAGVCNLEGAKFAKECGFSRVILARETPLSEIEKIANFIETEVFVQGALCTCFSGQCYFSSFAGGNSGNRGRCKQPCRKLYAYDRNGNTERNFALSLSDLSVGEDIEKLIQVGVVSFKIEGRMRRAEYVAAATRYYRSILDKSVNIAQKFSDLKRTYNRGNYTKGLAFGQDKRFLSTAIQGHLGEKIGVVKVVNGKFLVESPFQPQNGDAFKLLRDGKEIGGGIFVKQAGKCFEITSKTRLKNGDGVFITTDTEVNTRVLASVKKGIISFTLRFNEGEKAVALWNGITIESENRLQTAQNRPLGKEEIETCFMKTDGLPIEIRLEKIEIIGNIFIPKSELNAFRRKVYEEICAYKARDNRLQLSPEVLLAQWVVIPQNSNNKIAVIADDFDGVKADIAIFKVKNYADNLPESFTRGNFEKYIYYPAFATQKELCAIEKYLRAYSLDGIYAENYGGISFAEEKGVKLFAGTGFNLTNTFSVFELLRRSCLAYYAVSKELNEREAEGLLSEKSFALSSGNIKIMDLCYCPFGKTCNQCDKKYIYRLTDENNRVFPVRRIVDGDGDCRFEVYNCANLVSRGIKNIGKLLDLSIVQDKSITHFPLSEEKQKELYETCTSGHYKRGVL